VPEYPDLEVYKDQIETRLRSRVLRALRVRHPFVLRSVTPPPAEFSGRRVVTVERIGKRLVLGFDGDRFAALHLMLLGRLAWLAPGAKVRAQTLVAFDFEHGSLAMTESGSKRRAQLHLASGRDALLRLERGGMELFQVDLAEFAARIGAERHTLKRVLVDPAVVAAVGNAYSDEILFRACLSPLAIAADLRAAEVERLFNACRSVLDHWRRRLALEAGDEFPRQVTAFRPDMAVHGRFGQACRTCGGLIQRIVRGEQECNYCPGCQTAGKLLPDRLLSKLLRDSWPDQVSE
jgi:formamidopyrimidine-DNA glycosylase